ncbi:titin-like isoform X3 [Mytilus californianus]|uniref:titin-like isoform X3 n=1 Tax=Mytilus californianus TaxID=6549 RepID=UPI002246ADE9|nr:titin-like isoform X3 [Mytilus californianus]
MHLHCKKMDKIFFLLMIDALLTCSTAQSFVKLSGNQHVKRFGNVRLNCSSNNTPIANTASIQIDGKSYTTITLKGDDCFSSILGKKCTPDVCECSNRGLWYSHTYKIVQHVGVVNFICLMTFKANGLLSDSISVKIIDFTGPSITTEPGLPFPSGSNVAFTCMVDTLSTNITFEWDCLGKREPQSRSFFGSKSTKYSSVITRNIQLIHDGETCRCCINVDGIRGNSEISLAISRKPIIDISKAATCESYSTITLYCVIHTGFPLFGFNNWIHSRHGTLIRHLEGEKMHTMSILKFNSCSRDDTGDYTCEAYNRYEGNLTFANKTVSLIVYGPPIIKSEKTVTCYNSSVTLSCNIDTVLPVYGFNPWIHYFNGTFVRSLNGSVQEMKSILEVDTCSYYNAGEYMCAAWNKYGDTALVANKTIVLVVNASPVIISSGVIREQQTILSATFYSTTEVLLTWRQSNQTLTNSTDRLQMLDRKTIELILYNKNIECDGYIANLSIRSSLVGEYVLLIQNTFGTTRLFYEVNKLSTQGPPIIKSEETVTCNNSSVTLSCNIDTGLPVYGFNPWIHYFNGTIVRSLNGSVQEMKSTLEVETCSYQNAGAYMCAAWNKYGDTTLVANKTIVLVVNASPVIISSSVIRGQQTLSATFYSTTEVLLTWQQSNQTLTNSTDRLQTLDRKKIELILYNKSIECDGFIANLSIRSSLVGEYVLLITNTFGETRLFFDVNELGTQALTTSYDLRIVVFSIIAIGIFILSTAGTVIVSKGIRRKNVIHIIGPHERCPTIPIYHTAPAFDTTPNVYAIPETGYQQVTNEQYELDNFQDTENKGVENYTSRYMSSLYDEIDV